MTSKDDIIDRLFGLAQFHGWELNLTKLEEALSPVEAGNLNTPKRTIHSEKCND